MSEIYRLIQKELNIDQETFDSIISDESAKQKICEALFHCLNNVPDLSELASEMLQYISCVRMDSKYDEWLEENLDEFKNDDEEVAFKDFLQHFMGKTSVDNEDVETIDLIFKTWRQERDLQSRKDAADKDTEWITVNGTPIPLDGEGNMTGKVAEKIKATAKGAGGSSKTTDKSRTLTKKMSPARTDYDFAESDDVNDFINKNVPKLMPIFEKGGSEAVDSEFYKFRLSQSTKDIHEISKTEADAVVYDHVRQSLFDGWFRNADSSYKPALVSAMIGSQEMRNAGLSLAYENYKYNTDNPLPFEEFLVTPVKMYRGGHGQRHTEDDVFSAYTFDRKTAEYFAGPGGVITEAEIRPIDTYGSMRCVGEAEIWVPREISPNGNRDSAEDEPQEIDKVLNELGISKADFEGILTDESSKANLIEGLTHVLGNVPTLKEYASVLLQHIASTATRADGGPGSGNFGHKGVPGQVGGSAPGNGSREVVHGKDISRTYTGDKSTKAIVEHQGFGGLPKIVGKKEFDEAVKASKFIAQRTYSASSQEVLDAYRNQLLNGDFYVDCSTGGSQYGQGMYCAADYEGKLSEGIKEEMRHYQSIGLERYGADIDNGSVFSAQKKEAKQAYKDTLKAEVEKLSPEERRRYEDFWVIDHSDKLTDEEVRKFGRMEDKAHEKEKEISSMGLEDYAKSRGIQFNKVASAIETITLAPDAKIITYDDIRSIQYGKMNSAHLRYRTKRLGEIFEEKTKGMDLSETERIYAGYKLSMYEDDPDEKERAIAKLKKVPKEERSTVFKRVNEIAQKCLVEYDKEEDKYRDMDTGAFAALLGYDAINAEGHGASGSYTVVLNRTKCIFLDDSIHEDAKDNGMITFKQGEDGVILAVRKGQVIGWVRALDSASEERTDGGPGSGNFGHRGRVGEVGGSVSDGPFDSSKCNVSFGFGDELPKKDVDRALSLCGAKEINPGENDEVRVRKGPDGVIRAQVETPDTYAKVFIRDDRKELYLDELFLKNKGTGKGTAIVNEMVHQAESNGLETIRLIGGGIKGDSMNGYYSFARLGFDADLPDKTVKKAADLGIHAKKLSDLMETEEGRTFWKENGYAIEMTFDVRDGSISRKTLKSYIESRADGGPGSGNHGHKGVPGQVGGSAPSGSDSPAKTAKKSKKDFLPATSYTDTPAFQKAAKAAKEARQKNEKAWSRIKGIDEELKKESKPKPQKDWDDNDMLEDLLGRRPKILTERGKQLQKERAEAWKEMTEADHQFSEEGKKMREMKRDAHRREIKNFHPEPLTPAKSDEYEGFTLEQTSNSYGDEYLRNGKGVICEMTPKEYLERCAFEIFDEATMESCVGAIDEEVAQGYAKQMREGVRFHLPYLNYRQSGQEGRHRAYAAYLAGIEKMPVLIIGRPNRHDGGPGSGNFGHKGRPGEIGGSAPEEGSGKKSKASKAPPEPKIEFMSKRKANEYVSQVSNSSESEEDRKNKIGEFLKTLPVGSKVQTPAHWNDDGKPDTLIWDGSSWATRKGWDSGGWSCPNDEMAWYFVSEDEKERPVITSIASTPEEKKKWAEQYDKANWRGNEQVWQKGGSFGEKTKIRMRKQDVDGCGVGTVVTGSDGRKYVKDYDGFEKSKDGTTDITKYAWRDVETYARADMRVLKSPTFEGDFFAVNFGLNGVQETECSMARAVYERLPGEMKPVYERIFRQGNFVPSMPTPDDPEPGSYFSPWDGKVHFGKNATAQTVYHESTHAFDRGALSIEVDIPGGGKYTISSASGYIDHLALSSEDERRDFEAMAKVFGFKTNGEGWFSEEYGNAEEFETAVKLMHIYNEGCRQFEGMEGFDCVSDAVSALTHDKCLASFFHGGHDTKYWRQPYGGSISSNRSKEYWANYCQLRAFGSKDALALLERITPAMYSAAEKAYKEVFGDGEE